MVNVCYVSVDMEIKEKVLSIFTDVIGEQVTEDSTCEDMCFDSIDKALVSLEIEATFEIDITDEDFENSKTISDIINIVTNKYGNGNIQK